MRIEPPKQNLTLKLPITCSKSNAYPSRCSTEIVHGNTPKTLSLNREKHQLPEVYTVSTSKFFQYLQRRTIIMSSQYIYPSCHPRQPE